MLKVLLVILCLILVQFLKGSAVAEDSDEARQQEEECGSYAHKIVKPMMAYFDQVNRKIDENAEELENKNRRIRELEEREIGLQGEVAQLRLEITASKDAIIKILEDKNRSNADHMDCLKLQIKAEKRRKEKINHVLNSLNNYDKELMKFEEKIKKDAEEINLLAEKLIN